MFADVMSTGRHRLCLASICEPDDICRTIIFWRGEKSLDYEKSPLAVDDLSKPVDIRLTMSRARLHLNDRYLSDFKPLGEHFGKIRVKSYIL